MEKFCCLVVYGIRPNRYDSRVKKEKTTVRVLHVPVLLLFITSKIVHFSPKVISAPFRKWCAIVTFSRIFPLIH